MTEVGLPVQPWTIPAPDDVKRTADCCGIEVWLGPDQADAARVVCPAHVTPDSDAVVSAAIAYVESLTAAPIVGVPSREQPWMQARARLVAAVDEYRVAE